MKKNILIFYFVSTFFIGCISSNEPQNIPASQAFFDLETYFKKEIEQMQSLSSIQKTVSIDSKEEQKRIENVDFSKELEVFTQSNINKSSLLEKYKVDSLFNAKQELQQLSYSAQDPKLRTRNLSVFFDNKTVSKIEILNTTQNLIAQTGQELTYIPKEGYTIKNEQKIVFSEPKTMMVKVRF